MDKANIIVIALLVLIFLGFMHSRTTTPTTSTTKTVVVREPPHYNRRYGYVPPPPQNIDYIKNYEQTSDMINQYNKGKHMNDSLDDMYNEIQTPILLAVLYFLFQLPFFKRFLFTYISFLFSNDGNYNINGYLFTSVLFGLLFHLLMKTTSYFGTF